MIFRCSEAYIHVVNKERIFEEMRKCFSERFFLNKYLSIPNIHLRFVIGKSFRKEDVGRCSTEKMAPKVCNPGPKNIRLRNLYH